MITITPKIRMKDEIFYKKVLPWLTTCACLLILIGTILLIVGSGFNAGIQAAINSAGKDADKIPSPSSLTLTLASTTQVPTAADHLRVSMLNSFGSTFTAIGGFSLFVCLYFYVSCYLYRYEAYAEYDAELYDKLEKCHDLNVVPKSNASESSEDQDQQKNNLIEATQQKKDNQSNTIVDSNNVKKYSISQCLDCNIKDELGFSISESHNDMTPVWFAEKVNNASRCESLLNKIGIKSNKNVVAIRAYPYEDSVWLTIVDFNKPENNQIICLTDFKKKTILK